MFVESVVCWFEMSYHHQSREDNSPADARRRFDSRDGAEVVGPTCEDRLQFFVELFTACRAASGFQVKLNHHGELLRRELNIPECSCLVVHDDRIIAGSIFASGLDSGVFECGVNEEHSVVCVVCCFP